MTTIAWVLLATPSALKIAVEVGFVVGIIPQISPTGAAMVICPGGAYAHLAAHEGNDYALWLNQHGVTCFVLKYRLGSSGYHYPVEFQDVTRAIRWVRAHAADYQIDPNRIGIMGSSAGGHLASTALTHFDSGNPNAVDPIDKVSSRPDLGILCYPVITMGAHTHIGSMRNLLGDNPDPKLIEFLSGEKQVTPETPPVFIFGGRQPVAGTSCSRRSPACREMPGTS